MWFNLVLSRGAAVKQVIDITFYFACHWPADDGCILVLPTIVPKHLQDIVHFTICISTQHSIIYWKFIFVTSVIRDYHLLPLPCSMLCVWGIQRQCNTIWWTMAFKTIFLNDWYLGIMRNGLNFAMLSAWGTKSQCNRIWWTMAYTHLTVTWKLVLLI